MASNRLESRCPRRPLFSSSGNKAPDMLINISGWSSIQQCKADGNEYEYEVPYSNSTLRCWISVCTIIWQILVIRAVLLELTLRCILLIIYHKSSNHSLQGELIETVQVMLPGFRQCRPKLTTHPRKFFLCARLHECREMARPTAARARDTVDFISETKQYRFYKHMKGFSSLKR